MVQNILAAHQCGAMALQAVEVFASNINNNNSELFILLFLLLLFVVLLKRIGHINVSNSSCHTHRLCKPEESCYTPLIHVLIRFFTNNHSTNNISNITFYNVGS